MTRFFHPTRKQLGWILYDFSNSTYHLMIPTVLMPLYFRSYLAAHTNNPDFVWALTVSIPVVVGGILAPFVGAWADLHRSRVRMLGVSAFVSIAFLMLLFVSKQGQILIGALFFGISYAFFILSLSLYDALLPLVARRKSRALISGTAWGIGYIGGIIALLIVAPLIANAVLPEDIAAFRSSTIIVAIIFAFLAVISLMLLRGLDQSERKVDTDRASIRSPITRVVYTLRHWRRRSNLFKVLGSYYFANDGLATMTYFTAIYATISLGFSTKEVLSLFIIVQVIGVPAAIVAGLLATKLGHRSILFALLALWIGLAIGFAAAETLSVFYILAGATGLLIGSTPAIYRSYLADFIDDPHTAELFGFNSFASRASAVIGPLLFGVVASVSGSQRIAILSLVLFFVLAAILLALAPNDRNAQAEIEKDFSLP